MENLILNKKYYYSWWKNIDKTIFSIIILLFVVGLFFSLVSTSLVASNKLNTNDFSFFFKHSIFIFLGLLIIFFISSIDIKKLYKFSVFMFFLSIFFLILVPLIGVEVKGSKRWLDFILVPRFQPVELIKPFYIVMISMILSNNFNLNINYKYFVSLFIAIFIAALLMIQPDIGQTLLILSSWAILIFTSGVNIYIFSIFILLSFSSLLYVVMFVPKFAYIQKRIFLFLILKLALIIFNLIKL